MSKKAVDHDATPPEPAPGDVQVIRGEFPDRVRIPGYLLELEEEEYDVNVIVPSEDRILPIQKLKGTP
jgi:hypothetical protein